MGITSYKKVSNLSKKTRCSFEILAFKKKERKQIPNKTSHKTLIVIKTIIAKVGIVHCKVVNIEFAKQREHAAYIISLILTITNQKF